MPVLSHKRNLGDLPQVAQHMFVWWTVLSDNGCISYKFSFSQNEIFRAFLNEKKETKRKSSKYECDVELLYVMFFSPTDFT